MRTSGNTVLVTGGTGGIGRALAGAFHARGNRVVVAGRRRGSLDSFAAAHPGALGLPLDLADPAAPAGLAAALRARAPELNVVVANAGISRREDVAAEGWNASAAEDIVAINIVGVIRTVAATLPLIRGRPGAALMVTTSNLAFVPRADFPAYCASKAFLHSWLQSLRHQLRGVPVEVLELAPPYVQTALTGAEQAADPRAMPLDAYAAEVMALLEAGDHPRGEVLVSRDRGRRSAEREGRYEAVFDALNPR